MDRKVDNRPAPATAKPRSGSAPRVRRHREKMKAMGLKPATIWVPDNYRSPEWKAEIRRQCRLIANDPQEQQILAEIEDWYDPEGWK